VERKPVPLANAERLLRAMKAMADAKDERNQAILAALKAGGSIREIAKVAGMSESQILTISKDMGWPDKAELARRAREKAAQADIDKLIGRYRP